MDALYSVVFAGDAHASLIAGASPFPLVRVKKVPELVTALAKRRPRLVFISVSLLPQLEKTDFASTTVIGIVDGTVAEIVQALVDFPMLQNVVSTTMLASSSARAHLVEIAARIEQRSEHTVLGESGVGRVALLSSSSRRATRLERVAEFFAAHSIPDKTIVAMNDIAEELVTNALYDAPRDGGFVDDAVPRTASIELPPEHACEISYGIEGERVFVRVRDPFGAFTRARLVQVLARCRSTDVPLDESRGGAGLGMWRIFSTASTIMISVIPGRLTDILVWVDSSKRRPTGRLHTVQLLFPLELALDGARGRFAAEHDYDLMDESFTAFGS